MRTAETELQEIVDEIQAMEGRFRDSGSLGLHLDTDDETQFKALIVDAKSVMDTELGIANNYSLNMIQHINSYSGGYLGGPSFHAVQGARKLIETSIKQIRRKAAAPSPTSPFALAKPTYVALSRIGELHALRSKQWDVTRLIRLLEELNIAHANDCHMTTAMLGRAIKDHVPPIFGQTSFAQVASNAAPTNRSFKGSMQSLENSLKHIADSYLHQHIRTSEVLPTALQVDFRADLDVLLGEIVRVLR